MSALMIIITILVAPIIIILLFSNIIILFFNFYEVIAYFNQPEYYCAKCGEMISRKTIKCPKCKTILRDEKEKSKNE